MNLTIVGRTHVGKVRHHNEDCIWLPPDGVRDGQPALLVVADGMGGQQAGEVASTTTVESFVSTYFAAHGDPDVRLRQAVEVANAGVLALAQRDVRYRGMGSTLVAAVVEANHAWVCHVGDSRCYLIRGGRALRLTQDHSWVEEEVRAGRLSARAARTHPQRNIVTRGIGAAPSVAPDVTVRNDLRAGDAVLLCSDGLSSVVDDGEIARVAGSVTPREAVDRLIDLANRRGGPDNVSVVMARIDRADGEAETLTLAAGHSGTRGLVVGAILAAALAGGLLSGYLATRLQRNDSPRGDVSPNSAVAAAVPTQLVETPAIPAPTPTFTPGSCADGTPAEIYTVQSGDTLWDIAHRRGLDVAQIRACSGLSADESDLFPGSELFIPAAAGASTPARQSASQTPTARPTARPVASRTIPPTAPTTSAP